MARELVDVSLEFYEDELRRKTELEKLEFWESILSTDYTFDSVVIHPDGSTTIHPYSDRWTAIRIAEVKNEIGEGKSDPIMQAERSYASIFCSTGVGLFSSLYRPSTEGPCIVRVNSRSLMLSSNSGGDCRPAPDCHWGHLRR